LIFLKIIDKFEKIDIMVGRKGLKQDREFPGKFP